ncbi:MAG: hypothetical protein ACRYG4_00510, partial [Janthinobacterium lividum]
MTIIGAAEDAVTTLVPGGGILVALKRIPAWAWVTLAAVVALWVYGRYERSVGVAAEHVRTVAALSSLAASEANVGTLKASLATQDAAVAALRTAADAKVAASHTAVVAAGVAYKPTAGLIAKLAVPATSALPSIE